MCFVLLALGALGSIYIPQFPGVSLLAGFCVATIASKPTQASTSAIAKLLLAWAIVALGSTVTIETIVALTSQYFFLTASAIIITLLLAWQVGKLLKIDLALAALIGSGTAICGASAIASVGGALKSPPEQLSMALGVVLVLNAVALLLFPELGHVLNLTPNDFAVWAGLAIHDTSSVIGAAISYNPGAVDVATTVKLARAVWIAPLTLAIARLLLRKSDSPIKPRLPWFICGYLCAAFVAGYFEVPHQTQQLISSGARSAFAAGLFLTGASVNIRSLAILGPRPFLLGLALWLVSAGWSLAGVLLSW